MNERGMLRPFNPSERTAERELSEEEINTLVAAAAERIEIIDGVEYLDGFQLAPDNDELFDPERKFTVHAQHWYHRVEKGEDLYAVHEKTYTTKSTLTNRRVREANIWCIAQGQAPLFIKWEDVLLREPAPKPGLLNKAKAAGRLLLERTRS